MEIHQILVTAAPGDAVTNAAVDLRTLLRRIAPSEIYARFVHPALDGDVRSLDSDTSSMPRRADVVVYHAAIGDPHVVKFLLDFPGRLVLLYHNITPAEHFATLDPPFAQLLAAGRAELRTLRPKVALALAVSGFNARELEGVGYRDVRVTPLAVDVDRLSRLEPDGPTQRRLADEVEGPVLLFVGQLLPHKRPDLLLQAFHVLCTYSIPEAHLALVGPTRSDTYRRALEGLIEELGLNAHITGWIGETQLAAFYRAASCFVTMSEHEGFCVPLLEAMALDVPVVARSFAAIPETMGDAGLLLPPDDDPLLVAEAIHEAVSRVGMHDELVSRGRRRIRQFDPDAARATFLTHLAEVV